MDIQTVNEPKFFYIYNSYLEGIEPLSYSERGRLFTALLKYSSSGEEMPLPGAERFVFPLMRDQITRDKENYIEKARKNSLNGKKGALIRKSRAEGPLEPRSDGVGPAPDYEIPSLKQVEDFCSAFRLSVDPKRFFDFFEAGAWRDSSGKRVCSWQQKLLTWNLYEGNLPPRPEEKRSMEMTIDLEELKRSIDKI